MSIRFAFRLLRLAAGAASIAPAVAFPQNRAPAASVVTSAYAAYERGDFDEARRIATSSPQPQDVVDRARLQLLLGLIASSRGVSAAVPMFREAIQFAPEVVPSPELFSPSRRTLLDSLRRELNPITRWELDTGWFRIHTDPRRVRIARAGPSRAGVPTPYAMRAEQQFEARPVGFEWVLSVSGTDETGLHLLPPGIAGDIRSGKYRARLVSRLPGLGAMAYSAPLDVEVLVSAPHGVQLLRPTLRSTFLDTSRVVEARQRLTSAGWMSAIFVGRLILASDCKPDPVTECPFSMTFAPIAVVSMLVASANIGSERRRAQRAVREAVAFNQSEQVRVDSLNRRIKETASMRIRPVP